MNFKFQISNFKLWILLGAGLLLRLYLATLPGFKIDIDSFFAWAIRLADLGLQNFYSKDVFTDYTPGYLYILYFLGLINKIFSFSGSQFFLLLKFPAIVAEMALAVLVFLVGQQYKLNLKTNLFFTSLIVFNLGLIFNSALWGQVDSVLTFFMVLSIYFLSKKKIITASIMLGLAFLIKPQTISLFPVFLLFILKNKNREIFFKTTVPAILLVLIFALPFFPADPLFGLINKVLETSKEYPYTSLYAFNFWGIVGVWLSDLDKWYYSLSYQLWGYLLFAVFWLITAYYYFRKNIPLYTISAIATLGFYFLPTRVHERYLYPALVFLLLSAIELRSKWLIFGVIILSLSYFLNLYYVYIYYNYIYVNAPVALWYQNLYNLIDSNIKLLSGLNTALFLMVTIYILSHRYDQKNIKKS